jgi:hypothetical protein
MIALTSQMQSVKHKTIVRKIFKIIGYSIVGSCLLFLLLYLINPRFSNKSFRQIYRNTLGLTCVDYKQPVYSKKLNNIIPDYIESAKLSGIKKCKDEKEILERAAQGKLVEIKDGKGYFVSEMSHSYPYLTRDARDLVLIISKRFREKIAGTRLKGSSFKITSLTRTTDKLKKLRGVNSNTSLNSPHLYGNAFDISYIRFSTKKMFLTNCDEKYLMEALAEVIWKLKKEKKCWATFEVQQNCFHVVAR